MLLFGYVFFFFIPKAIGEDMGFAEAIARLEYKMQTDTLDMAR